jgi:hypothetical protein
MAIPTFILKPPNKFKLLHVSVSYDSRHADIHLHTDTYIEDVSGTARTLAVRYTL